MITAPPLSTAAPAARPTVSWRYVLYEHGLPLLFFTLLAIALTWPMARDFASTFPSDGGDADHNIWLIWHVREALLGHEPLYEATRLYYPHGITLLSHNPGPLVGFLALPFWSGGAVAAHNGALLVGFLLTGYFMYLLARGVGLDRWPALLAGVVYTVSDMHLAGIYGHIDKVALGLIPLAMLTWLHTLNPQRRPWWGVATAFVLLLALLTSGWQFILITFGLAFMWLVAMLTRTEARRAVLQRTALTAVATVILVGPLLYSMAIVTRDMGIDVDKRLEASTFAPDLVEFVMPRMTSRSFNQPAAFLASHDIKRTIETAIALGWLPALLALFALRVRRAWPWLLFTLFCIVMSLGPFLKAFGHRAFTAYHIQVALPYAFLTSLPGLDFMRTPGRFMLIGAVGLALCAAFGAAWLAARWPRWSTLILLTLTGLTLLEAWPRPWPTQTLPAAPAFYQELAKDSEMYGVFDLPLTNVPVQTTVPSYSSRYQAYQMTHGKGLAGGYLSRVYARHPVFPCLMMDPPPENLRINGDTYDCRVDAQQALADAGFRYVVWHKAQPDDRRNPPGGYGEAMSKAFIKAAFGDTPPIIDDNEVAVYEVRPETLPPRGLGLTFADNWYEQPQGGPTRWAASPATLTVTSPVDQTVTFEIKPANMYVPSAKSGFGGRGVLNVQVEDWFSQDVPLKAESTARLAIPLHAGEQTIRLALEAGNFRPIDQGEGSRDARWLSFDIRRINLRTEP